MKLKRVNWGEGATVRELYDAMFSDCDLPQSLLKSLAIGKLQILLESIPSQRTKLKFIDGGWDTSDLTELTYGEYYSMASNPPDYELRISETLRDAMKGDVT